VLVGAVVVAFISFTGGPVGAAPAGAGGWAPQRIPATTGALGDVACVDSLHCWAVGGPAAPNFFPSSSIIATTDGGQSWTTEMLPTGLDGYGATGISCVNDADCWLSAHNGNSGLILHTRDGGHSWASQFSTNQVVSDLSCTDPSHCWALVNEHVIATGDGGLSWADAGLTLPAFSVGGITCLQAGHCWVPGGTVTDPSGATTPEIFATVNGGSTWSTERLPPAIAGSYSGSIFRVSCASVLDCVAVGNLNRETSSTLLVRAIAYRTTDGGAHWTLSANVPSTVVALSAATCTPGTLSCWAVGWDFNAVTASVLVSRDLGLNWSVQTAAAQHGTSLEAGIACPTTFACWEVGVDSADVQGVVRATSAASPLSTVGAYDIATSDGEVFRFGSTAFYGSLAGTHLNQPIVGVTLDPATGGYWLVAADGGVFAFHAPYFGSTGNIHLNKPIVGMAAAPGGNGYWLIASDGGVFSFGPAARYFGSLGGIHLNQPIVGIAPDPATGGYWLVAADGGVFAFHAPFLGSVAGSGLPSPIIAMTGSS
jgi:photosystem II stability/assembly factor-like uncharacterized protein